MTKDTQSAPADAVVRRPPAVCCPECGRVCEYEERGENYPCERCGVLWRWYCRSGTHEGIEVKQPKAWRSIAVWPDTIRVGHTVGKNESDDTHTSREAAEAVCGLLRKHGFGGDGKVFPVSTRVEPVWSQVRRTTY